MCPLTSRLAFLIPLSCLGVTPLAGEDPPAPVVDLSDRNGKVEISDAVAILNYLFGGAVPPGCLDAADADDSGRLDITDPIRILGFLFLGGAPPPKPGASDPGADPTEDKLSCLE